MRLSRSALASAVLMGAAAGVVALPGTGYAQTVGTGSISGTTSPSVGGGTGVSSSDATQLRATQGSSTIDSTNVDALARSGTIGTSAVDALGPSSDPMNSNYSAQLAPVQSTAPRLPSPKVGIDLQAIRRGLDAAPSATPDAAGN